jgi:hypothetical protein
MTLYVLCLVPAFTEKKVIKSKRMENGLFKLGIGIILVKPLIALHGFSSEKAA